MDRYRIHWTLIKYCLVRSLNYVKLFSLVATVNRGHYQSLHVALIKGGNTFCIRTPFYTKLCLAKNRNPAFFVTLCQMAVTHSTINLTIAWRSTVMQIHRHRQENTETGRHQECSREDRVKGPELKKTPPAFYSHTGLMNWLHNRRAEANSIIVI